MGAEIENGDGWPRRGGSCRSLLAAAIAGIAILSAPLSASAATGAQAGVQLRDGLLIVVSGLPPAPASLGLRFDRGRARVFAQQLLKQPLAGLAPGGGSYRFSSRADGFTLHAVSAGPLAKVSMGLLVVRPGRPITGRVRVPRGTTVVVSMPNGRQMLLRGGRFSIPTSTAGIGSPVEPELAVHPSSVRPGGAISVTGDVGSHCGIGRRVTLTSAAFRGLPGERAMTTVVLHEGAFVLRTSVARARHLGRYTIRARCGGGEIGVATHLLVGSHVGRGPGQPPPVDTCAPGQYDVYVCTTMFNLIFATTLNLVSEWHSCGGTNPPAAQTLAYGAQNEFKAYCAVDFWGSVEYSYTPHDGSSYAPHGLVVINYSTFTGDSSCNVYIDTVAYCVAGDAPLLAVNPQARDERWHYVNSAGVFAPSGDGRK